MITREEAGESLRDIEAVRERSALAHGYRTASPHLLVWGVIWGLGYGLPATVSGCG